MPPLRGTRARGPIPPLGATSLPARPEALRVAMLSPIAWRTPPRHYGPWEQVVSLLTEGLVRRGVDVTLFATGDSLTTARLQRGHPHRLRGRPHARRQGVGVAAHLGGVRAGRGVRPHPQPLRLPAADVLAPDRDAGGGHHPRVLVRAHPARLPQVRRHRPLCRHQRRRPRARPALRGHGVPRHRSLGVHLPARSRRVPPVLRPHPPGQGRLRGHRDRAPHGAEAGHGRA